jgi:hypothetical protein
MSVPHMIMQATASTSAYKRNQTPITKAGASISTNRIQRIPATFPRGN